MSSYEEGELESIICYPEYSSKVFRERLTILNELGIKLLRAGSRIINNKPVIGKGHTGIVVKGLMNGNVVAVKIRRVDSKHRTLYNEAKMLKLANKIGIGPILIYESKDIIVMEYIDGMHIRELLRNNYSIRYIINDLLWQCFMLDLIGLDHGELYRMDRHLIVNDNSIKIIDFDSASINRRVANVTSAIQYFLINTKLDVDKDSLFEVLRSYKRCICSSCLERLFLLLKVK